MDNRPIGIFDSGLGGLTTFKELHSLLPNERLVYFGDTGRIPYGTRSRETVRRYAAQDIRFLLEHDVKMVIAACGTVSALLTPEMTRELDGMKIPFSGVVLPAAQAACAATVNGRIGVIGTTATMRSGAYGRAIRGIHSDARVIGNACPLFVPLVEAGFIQPDNEITSKVAELYLAPIIAEQVDTLILGCTHYPLIYDILNRLLDYKVTLIDAGKQVARWAQAHLSSEDMLCDTDRPGDAHFFVSDSVESFRETAELFLGRHLPGEVRQVNIEAFER